SSRSIHARQASETVARRQASSGERPTVRTLPDLPRRQCGFPRGASCKAPLEGVCCSPLCRSSRVETASKRQQVCASSGEQCLGRLGHRNPAIDLNYLVGGGLPSERLATLSAIRYEPPGQRGIR